MRVYYNEFDKKKCAALSQLMKDGLISKGDIDDRSIRDVQPGDVKGYDRAHFFAGIGIWEEALRLAGWGDEPVWTGSCPCQPFSTAGKRKGKQDERHLWPEWFRLITQCRPQTIFGEQVASAIGSENKNLPNLLKRIGVIELLLAESQRQNILQVRLQVLRSKEKSSAQAGHRGAEPFDADEMEREIQRLNSLHGGEAQSEGYGVAVQPDSGLGAEENRLRGVRINGDSVQSGRRENMGQPLDRQDCTRQGLHEDELPYGDFFGECNDEQLGREQDSRDCQFYYGDQTETLRRFAEQARREFKETIAHGWLDDVYQGLEAQGYAVGAAVLPACSVGAPHRRERLWFVGNAEHDGSSGRQIAGGHGQAIQHNAEGQDSTVEFTGAGQSGDVADTECEQNHQEQQRPEGNERGRRSDVSGGCGVDSPWSTGIWIDCPDGKQRLVERSFRFVVDGSSVDLGSIHAACVSEAKESLIDYGTKNKTHPDKILQAVQKSYSEAAFQKRKASRSCGIYEDKVLLSFLQRVSSALNASENSGRVKKAHAYDERGNVRSLHLEEVFNFTPCGWKSYEQFAAESSDALQQLSFFLAQCAEASEFATKNSDAASIPLIVSGQTGRVGLLHSAGDGIVPQVAAAFIRAFKTRGQQ